MEGEGEGGRREGREELRSKAAMERKEEANVEEEGNRRTSALLS